MQQGMLTEEAEGQYCMESLGQGLDLEVRLQLGMLTEEKRQRQGASTVRRAEVIDWIWRSDCSKECRQRRRGSCCWLLA